MSFLRWSKPGAIIVCLVVVLSCGTDDALSPNPAVVPYPSRTGGGWEGCGDMNMSASPDERAARPNLDCDEGVSVEIDCTPSNVSFGGFIGCDLVIEPPNWTTVHVGTWQFIDTFGNSTTRAGGISWNGTMVSGGTMNLSVQVNGSWFYPSTQVSVSRRIWTWAPVVLGFHASANGTATTDGELDACFHNPNDQGTHSGTACNAQYKAYFYQPREVSQSGGYLAQPVPGTGPNGGFWYIVTPSATASMRSQINRKFRTDSRDYYPMTGYQPIT